MANFAVLVHCAKVNYSQEFTGKDNPMVLLQAEGHTAETQACVHGGKFPYWNEELRVPASSDLIVRVQHVEGGSPFLIGQGEVELREGEQWVIIKKAGRPTGSVKLTLSPTREPVTSRSSKPQQEPAPIASRQSAGLQYQPMPVPAYSASNTAPEYSPYRAYY
mmetsp:Transcript_602/g.1015  ORF Transcript_602/g.1015 Transcript_602/m.1015 type:complete len:163 (+) Transcript_602:2303-2791(+)